MVRQLYADTWNRVDKEMAPIVISWNGHDHYVPTILPK